MIKQIVAYVASQVKRLTNSCDSEPVSSPTRQNAYRLGTDSTTARISGRTHCDGIDILVDMCQLLRVLARFGACPVLYDCGSAVADSFASACRATWRASNVSRLNRTSNLLVYYELATRCPGCLTGNTAGNVSTKTTRTSGCQLVV